MSFPKREEIVFTDHGWIRREGIRDLAEYVWVEGDEGEEIRPEEGMSTPDGRVQWVKEVVAGVYWIDTGSHGFLVLSIVLAQQLLTLQACAIGEKQGRWMFFEEDCAVAAPLFEHPDWQSWSGFSSESYDAEEALRRFFPEYFAVPIQLPLYSRVN